MKVPIPKFLLSSGDASSVGDAVAPMPGVIEKVIVTPGSAVEKGDPLVIMIAMKMEVISLFKVVFYIILTLVNI